MDEIAKTMINGLKKSPIMAKPKIGKMDRLILVLSEINENLIKIEEAIHDASRVSSTGNFYGRGGLERDED